MILTLPVKKRFGWKEVPIEVLFRIGTLEDLCDDLGINFWQIKDFATKSEIDYTALLLWYGYNFACKENRQKTVYTKLDAALWNEKMSLTERKKFIEGMTELYGKMAKAYSTDKKKVVKKSVSQNSENLP